MNIYEYIYIYREREREILDTGTVLIYFGSQSHQASRYDCSKCLNMIPTQIGMCLFCMFNIYPSPHISPPPLHPYLYSLLICILSPHPEHVDPTLSQQWTPPPIFVRRLRT